MKMYDDYVYSNLSLESLIPSIHNVQVMRIVRWPMGCIVVYIQVLVLFERIVYSIYLAADKHLLDADCDSKHL